MATTGVFHTTYSSELRLRHTSTERVRLLATGALIASLPVVLDNYWLAIANVIGISVIGAVGLNILVGYTGQISLGQGGFLAVGAFTSATIAGKAGLPVPLAMIGAVLFTAVIGALFGLPALRLKGLYLAMATLASQVIIITVVRRWSWLYGDGAGFGLHVDRITIFGWRPARADLQVTWYWIIAILAILAVVTARNLFRTALGRSFMAVRDHDIAASAMGVNLTRTKLTAFAISSGYAGLAGALFAHYQESIGYESFGLDVSIAYLAMIIVGGLGSVAGAVYGAIFITVLNPLLDAVVPVLHDIAPFITPDTANAIKNIVFGLVIITFLLFEPRGLNRMWQRTKDYVRFWPFRY